MPFRRTAKTNDDYLTIKVDETKQDQELLIPELIPYTNYTVFVQAVGKSGLIGPVGPTGTQRTHSSAVSKSALELSLINIDPEKTIQTITVILPPANFTTGPLK